MSISVAKWTFFLTLCALRITYFLLLTLSSCHAGVVSSFSIPCPLQLLHPESSLLEAQEQFCAPNCNDSSK